MDLPEFIGSWEDHFVDGAVASGTPLTRTISVAIPAHHFFFCMFGGYLWGGNTCVDSNGDSHVFDVTQLNKPQDLMVARGVSHSDISSLTVGWNHAGSDAKPHAFAVAAFTVPDWELFSHGTIVGGNPVPPTALIHMNETGMTAVGMRCGKASSDPDHQVPAADGSYTTIVDRSDLGAGGHELRALMQYRIMGPGLQTQWSAMPVKAHINDDTWQGDHFGQNPPFRPSFGWGIRMKGT